MGAATLFNATPGRISFVGIDDGIASFSIKLDGMILTGILTQAAVNEEVMLQIATALDTSVHITAFGDKPSTITVNVLLNEQCSNKGLSPLDSYSLKYAQERLVPGNRPFPLIITIGNTGYQAFLIGNQLGAVATTQVMITGMLRFVGWRI